MSFSRDTWAHQPGSRPLAPPHASEEDQHRTWFRQPFHDGNGFQEGSSAIPLYNIEEFVNDVEGSSQLFLSFDGHRRPGASRQDSSAPIQELVPVTLYKFRDGVFVPADNWNWPRVETATRFRNVNHSNSGGLVTEFRFYTSPAMNRGISAPTLGSDDVSVPHMPLTQPISTNYDTLLPLGDTAADLSMNREYLTSTKFLDFSQAGSQDQGGIPEYIFNTTGESEIVDSEAYWMSEIPFIENIDPRSNSNGFYAQEPLPPPAGNFQNSHELTELDPEVNNTNPTALTQMQSRMEHTTVSKGRSKATKKISKNRGLGGINKNLRIMDQGITYEYPHSDPKEPRAMMIVFGATQRSRSKLDEVAKNQVRRARLIGACMRCKKLKKACNFSDSRYLPCESCMMSNPSRLHMPCRLQVSITDMPLFRLGPPVDNPDHPLMFFSHRQDLWMLSGDELILDTRSVKLTQDMGSVLNVVACKYKPHSKDKTGYEWSSPNGAQKMEMPPYCIGRIDDATESMREYAEQSKMLYLKNILDRSNQILLDTFSAAARSKSPMVQTALRLWSTNRLIERTWRLSGPEKLGITPVVDESNPWCGIVPVTPIMDQQLDQIVIRRILVPMKEELLKHLTKAIYDDRDSKNRWIEIFLTTFVLLNNCEIQLHHDRQFAKRYGMTGRYGPRGKYKDAEDQFHAARTMLAHFHFAYHGSIPLSLGYKTANPVAGADGDDQQLEGYIMQLKRQIHEAEKKQSMIALREHHQYENSMYWCHQLFYDHWDPGKGHIEELTEEGQEAPHT